MNFLWTILFCFSIIFFLFSDPNLLLATATASIYDSLKLCFTLAGIYIFWMGMIAIVEDSGLAGKLSKLLTPFISFIFGGVSKEARELIAVNMSANILGLGNASLPAGLKAMQKLNDERIESKKRLNGFIERESKSVAKAKRGKGVLRKCFNLKKGKRGEEATRAMIMLFAINCCSIQLLPSTVILMRSENGSNSSADIILPIILVSVVCFALTILFIKLLFKERKVC